MTDSYDFADAVSVRYQLSPPLLDGFGFFARIGLQGNSAPWRLYIDTF